MMNNQPSPLESLAAFAIAFVAGAVSIVGVAAYGAWSRSRAGKAASATKAAT